MAHTVHLKEEIPAGNSLTTRGFETRDNCGYDALSKGIRNEWDSNPRTPDYKSRARTTIPQCKTRRMTVDSLRNVYLIGHAIVTYEVIKMNTILLMLASEDLNWHELQCSIQIKSKWQYIMGENCISKDV